MSGGGGGISESTADHMQRADGACVAGREKDADAAGVQCWVLNWRMTMSDNDVIHTACAWVGWVCYTDSEDGIPYFAPTYGEVGRSNADLAEAVRVRLIRDFAHKNDRQGWGNPSTWALLSGIWMNNGPLAFLRAVMEVVDG